MDSHFIPKQLQTSVYFAKNKKCLSQIILTDRIKNDAHETIKSLNSKTILLSGDSPAPVEQIAKNCEFNEWHAQMSPFDKKEFIQTFERKET